MRKTRRLLALAMALVMALMCTVAFAQKVEIHTNVDAEAVKETLAGFGMPEEEFAKAEPIIKLINSAGIKVTTDVSGAEIALGLNEDDAIKIGFGATAEGIALVSNLIPSYKIILDDETRMGLLNQLKEKIPALAGLVGLGDADGATPSIPEGIMTAFQGFVAAMQEAAVPGETEEGEFEFEGVKFDYKTPINIDMEKISAAFKKLAEDLLADKDVNEILSQVASATSSELPSTDSLKESLDEFISNFPVKVTSNYYSVLNTPGVFYMEGDATHKDAEEASHLYTVISAGSLMKATYTNKDAGIDVIFTQNLDVITLEFKMGEMIDFVMKLTQGPDTEGAGYIYTIEEFLNSEKPQATITIKVTEDEERSLPLDAEGLTTVLVKDLLSSESEVSSALVGELGKNAMMLLSNPAIMELIPADALGGLMGSFMGDTVTTETPEEAPVEVTKEGGDEEGAALGGGVLGGWTVPFYKEPDMNDGAYEVFEKAFAEWTGVGFNPFALLGTQVVAGTNYAFLCLATPVVADPNPYWAIVYINEDLEGNANILNIVSLVPSLEGNEVAADIPEAGIVGGWTMPEDKSVKDNDNESFFDDTMDAAGLLGVKYEGEWLLGTQVVSGTNYAFLATATPITDNPDEQGQWKIVYIWQKADGTTEVTDIHDLVLGEYVNVEE